MKKLVIEIPDETYEQIKETRSIGGMMSGTIVDVILNGTPAEKMQRIRSHSGICDTDPAVMSLNADES